MSVAKLWASGKKWASKEYSKLKRLIFVFLFITGIAPLVKATPADPDGKRVINKKRLLLSLLVAMVVLVAVVYGTGLAQTIGGGANDGGAKQHSNQHHSNLQHHRLSSHHRHHSKSPSNRPPVVKVDSYSTDEDQTLTVDASSGLLKNDWDPEGASLTATLVTKPAHGTATLDSEGSFTYTPNKDYNGTDSFTYKANDGKADGNKATVSINVAPVNDVPSFTKGEDQTVNEDAGAQSNRWATGISAGGPATNESDQGLAFEVTDNTNAGLFAEVPVISSDGTLTYTPADDANGEATIKVRLTDDGGTTNGGDDTSDEQEFKITVYSVNDKPDFEPGGEQTVEEDSGAKSVTGWASGFDPGPDDESGQQLAEYIVTDTDGNPVSSDLFTDDGQPKISEDGTLTYTPADNASGSIDLKVKARDDGGTDRGGVDTSDAKDLKITITGANDVPTVSLSSPPDTANEGDTKTYDFTVTDPDSGDSFTIKSGFPDCGTGGELVGTPATTSSGGSSQCKFPDGSASPTVRIQVTDSQSADSNIVTQDVTVANVAPTVTFSEQNPTSVDESETDERTFTYTISDPGDDTVSSVDTGCGANGQKVVNSDTFTDTSGSFECVFGDGTKTSTVSASATDSDGDTGDTATQDVTINNAAPTISSVTNGGSVDEGSPATITVDADDPAGANDTLSYSFDCNGDGDYADTGDVGPQNGNSAQCTYQSAGTKTVNVRVEDGDGGSDTDSTTFTVRRTNAAPVAGNGTAQVNEDATTPVTIDFADFASDEETDAANLTYDITDPDKSQGTLTGTGSTRSFTPAADFNGTVEILYTVTDRGDPDDCKQGDPDCAPTKTSTQGKVSVTVSPVNDAPTASDGTASMDEDAAPIQINLGDFVSDKETTDANLTYTIVSDPSSEAGTLSGSGPTFTFDSADNFNGEASFTYKVTDRGDPDNCGTAGPSCDAAEESDTKTVKITINPVNDPPSVTPPTAAYAVQANMTLKSPNGSTDLFEGSTITDVDGSGAEPFSLTRETVTSAHSANVTLNADGSLTYEPPAGYAGQDTFTYHICDSGVPGPSACTAATATVNVSGPVIWFVDGNAASGGNGTLAHPFTDLSGKSGANNDADDVDAANQRIFVKNGSSSVTGGLTLNDGEWLVGEGATGTNFDQLMGITPPAGTISRPSINGTKPTITSGGVGLKSGNQLYGLAFSNTTGTAIDSKANVGTLILGNIAIDNSGSNGAGLILDDGGTSVTTTGTNTINTKTGTALNVANTTIGSNRLNFKSISANGAPNGIVLNNTGSTAGLTVTGNGGSCTIATPTCTGGTIQNTTADGISLTNTSNPSFGYMQVKDTAGHGIAGTTTSDLNLSNSLVQGAGDADNEAGLYFATTNGTNLTGNSSITNTVVNAPADVGGFIQNYGGTLNLTVSGSTFSGTQKNTPGVVTGDDLLRIISDRTTSGSATITAKIIGSTFKDSGNDDIQAGAQSSTNSGGGTMNLTVDGNHFDGNGVFDTCDTVGCNSYAIVTQGTQGSTIKYTIQNNDIVNHLDSGIAARSDNDSNVQGVIKNNTIGRADSPRSGSYRDRGIYLVSDDSSDFIARVENNTIYSTFFEGISASTTDGTGLSPKMDLTILGNTTPTPADTSGTYLPSIGMTASGNASACARAENNTAQPGRQGSIVGKNGPGSIDFLLFRDTATSTATFKLEGLSAPTADASSFVKSKNPDSADPVYAFASKDRSNSSKPQFTGGTCRTPAATPTP